ncbi:hypothetical protein LTR16_005397 [Cryomyces antarcticus]|uniref:Glycolipid transfer protein domain-containing protein n=1 Tax=Cryomyces antarcticus TaxID=329879 RepID=A0ABR0LMJ1_9PEZI|nr:hypothetical protein LTR16_005397 [Cryomyces antarcticus]
MATSKAYPTGGTYFDTMKRNFKNVPVDASKDNAIETSAFLEAAESLTGLFDVMGSVAFAPVKNDMVGNVKVPITTSWSLAAVCQARKVRDRQLAAPDQSETLQALCLNELKAKKHTATEGLLWLVRGLDFTAQSLRHNLSHPTEELSTSFRHAYQNTLKPHHSFLVKPIFSAAMSATPYRKDFYAKLAAEDNKEMLVREMGEWLEALERQVGELKEFLGRKEAKW